MTTHNLPHQSTPFVGRGEELVQIAGLLADPNCCLLTLVGAGGIGKTRLALQAAGEQIPHFAQGVYFVPLNPVGSADLLATAIASALEVTFFGTESLSLQLVQYLREKNMLLVMDNFEHLLDGVQLLTDILQAAPGVKILVTSRERLHLREEWVQYIRGLPFPTERTDELLNDSSAVRLFAQTARRAGYLHQSGDMAATGAIVRICQLVEGNPLAIELAAAWSVAIPCQQIAAEIEHGLDILTTTLRNTPEKHRSMRATFEYSWKLLTSAEQSLFRQLSVFRGGFTREAAHEVAGASLSVLAALADKSLIRLNNDGRYDLHELLRQYAAEQLNLLPDKDKQVRDLHCAYYSNFLRQRHEELFHAKVLGSQQASLVKIDSEIENVRLAIWRTIEQGQFQDISRCWESIWFFYEARNWFQEGEEICRAAIERLHGVVGGPEIERNHILALCLGWHAWFMWRLFRLPEAKKSTDECLSLLGATPGGIDRAYVLEKLGASATDYTLAKQLLEQAVAAGKAHQQFWWAASSLQTLSQYAVSRGEYEEAKRLAHESLSLCQQTNDQFIRLYVLLDLSNIAAAEADYTEAGYYADEARSASESFGYQWGVLRSAALQGNSALGQQDYAQANQRYRECLAIADDLGVRWFTGIAFLGLGRIASEVGAYQEAQGYFLDALRITESSVILPHFEDLMPRILNGIAALWVKVGKHESAVELIAAILNYPSGDRIMQTEVDHLRARLETELSPETYAASWERGSGLAVDGLIAHLMNELQHEPAIADGQASHDLFKVSPSLTAPLTARELEILQLMAQGMSNREIAEKLVLSVGTVKWYGSQICGKLQARNRVQAIAQARALNILL